MASEKVFHLTESDFNESIKEGITLVDFWAEWCGPCKALAPAIDQLAEDYDGKVKVAKVDVDSNQGIAGQFSIRGIPTVLLFKDGEQIDMFTGNAPGKIKEMIERHV